MKQKNIRVALAIAAAVLLVILAAVCIRKNRAAGERPAETADASETESASDTQNASQFVTETASESDPPSEASPEEESSEETGAGETEKSEETETQEPAAPRLEAFAISQENAGVANAVEYAIDPEAQSVSLTVSYDRYVDLFTLQRCKLDISVSGGQALLPEDCVNADGSVDLTKLKEITLTGENGVSKIYTVRTERIVYELPIINIYLKGGKSVGKIDRNAYTSMELYIDCTGADGFTGTGMLSGRIRGRGHSTWSWEKKPYRLKLDEGVSVLGLDKNKDWILLANYSDKSLMRNTLAYEMGKTLEHLAWTPTQYPVDVFINGEYQGVYSIGEQMEIAKNRVDIEKGSAEPDTGYLLEVGGVDDEEGLVLGYDYFHTSRGGLRFVTFKDPEADELTDAQREFIKDYVQKADAAIVEKSGYEEYIDVDSFCDWILLHELTYNLDSCFRRSCYLTKDKGGKLKAGPIWDFDLAFGNCNRDKPEYDNWATVGSDEEGAYVWVNWCNYLMEDEAFRARLRDRWQQVRDPLLSCAEKTIEENSQKLKRSQEQNFKVWDIWNKKAGYQSYQNLKYKTYEGQLQYLRDFLKKRAQWMDEHI